MKFARGWAWARPTCSPNPRRPAPTDPKGGLPMSPVVTPALPRLLARAALAAALAAGLACPAPAASPKPLRKELVEVAGVIHKHLRDRSDSVGIDAFTCASKPPTNHGPGIGLALSEELTRLGLRIDAAARFRVKGTYKVIRDSTLPVKQLAIKLDVRVEE